jgi:hypothetical protein
MIFQDVAISKHVKHENSACFLDDFSGGFQCLELPVSPQPVSARPGHQFQSASREPQDKFDGSLEGGFGLVSDLGRRDRTEAQVNKM